MSRIEARLTDLQRDVLDAFFRFEKRFFLTGGGALAGYHLGHRETLDLDLFTTESILDEGDEALTVVARELGASLEPIRTSPVMRRRIIHRDDESIVVDLVLDQVEQGETAKMRFGEIIVDPPIEILANKLCAALSRSEPRDLVDIMALEQAGHRIEDAIDLAMRKDGGLTPAQLGWVLSQIRIGEEAELPGGVEPAALGEYLERLQHRLARMAHP